MDTNDFIDKLIDEMSIRDNWGAAGIKGVLRLLMYLLIIGVIFVYLFMNNTYLANLEPYLDHTLKKILLLIMAAILFFMVVRIDDVKFLLELFFPVLLAYLSVCFVI